MKPSALIVDDDDRHAADLAAILERHGFRVARFKHPKDLRNADDGGVYAIAFITLECGGASGLDLLGETCLQEASELILMNAIDQPALVNRGIALGATYFFIKPFDEGFVDTLLKDLAAEERPAAEPETVDVALDQFGLLRGSSKPMRRLYRTMRKVAPSDASVLLVGESGTGKELVARSLHMMSGRADQDFVAMNCAAIPKDLFESELFGHEKGSFSGAVRQHRGFFERAHGGTLFLDEITEMPIELQAKLLRVLELGEFRRVGAENDTSSDVRIIASTNRVPEEAIDQGLLREDLYYRVARFPLYMPPLNQRGSDVIGLAQFFLNELNGEYETAVSFGDSAIEQIRAYQWPGNVRELRSVIERAYILANDQIELDHMKDLDLSDGQEEDFIRVAATDSVEDAERKLIYAALEAHDSDKRAAARSLGISLKTLYNRLNQYSEDETSSGADIERPSE
ncbi:MAG: sigma-54 dependent transcriptional regulator [Pseudomonadales bacterium]